MSNEDLTIIILDKLNWQYDDIANPEHYKNTKDIFIGDLVFSILENESIERVGISLNTSYKSIRTTTVRLFEPIFGQINGGGDTWRYRLALYAGYKRCSGCHNYNKLEELDTDNSNSDGKHSYCKSCRSTNNSTRFKKESYQEAHKRSQEKHYYDILARNAEYRAERKLRTVSWADQEKIKEVYKNCPEGKHVDHRIPLKGELVSGLHVHNNLQYLSPEENLKKGNKYEIE